MKQVFTIAPFLLLMLLGQFRPLHPEVATNVYARTGSRGAACSGSGICTISTSGSQAPMSEGYKASFGYDAERHIFLEFKYFDLSSEVVAAQFNADVFEMQSECPVSANVLQAINATDTELTLKPGFYPLSKTGQTVRITFN